MRSANSRIISPISERRLFRWQSRSLPFGHSMAFISNWYRIKGSVYNGVTEGNFEVLPAHRAPFILLFVSLVTSRCHSGGSPFNLESEERSAASRNQVPLCRLSGTILKWCNAQYYSWITISYNNFSTNCPRSAVNGAESRLFQQFGLVTTRPNGTKLQPSTQPSATYIASKYRATSLGTLIRNWQLEDLGTKGIHNDLENREKHLYSRLDWQVNPHQGVFSTNASN